MKANKYINKVPNHLAIIMDGNGRWAKQQNKKRIHGHKEGIKSVRKVVEYSAKIKIKYLTLFTFSNENWYRPPSEILSLMKLLCNTLDNELELLLKNNIKLNVIGDSSKLDVFTRKKINTVANNTKMNTGLNLNLAISYGSRQEIIYAINKLVKENNNKKIDEKLFKSFLYTSDYPDPDFLIRTGGDLRLSNFLLWQLAYTEIYFSDLFWPDFNEKELEKALLNYQSRERRFGKISEQLK